MLVAVTVPILAGFDCGMLGFGAQGKPLFRAAGIEDSHCQLDTRCGW